MLTAQEHRHRRVTDRLLHVQDLKVVQVDITSLLHTHAKKILIILELEQIKNVKEHQKVIVTRQDHGYAEAESERRLIYCVITHVSRSSMVV